MTYNKIHNGSLAEVSVVWVLSSLFIFSARPMYSIPDGWNIKKRIKHVCKRHCADLEIGNVSARQAALNRWTATVKRWKRKTVFRGPSRVIYYLFHDYFDPVTINLLANQSEPLIPHCIDDGAKNKEIGVKRSFTCSLRRRGVWNTFAVSAPLQRT